MVSSRYGMIAGRALKEYSRRLGCDRRHCGGGQGGLEVFGVDDVVHVSFVVGVDAAGGIVLPLSVCDKLRGHVSGQLRGECEAVGC